MKIDLKIKIFYSFRMKNDFFLHLYYVGLFCCVAFSAQAQEKCGVLGAMQWEPQGVVHRTSEVVIPVVVHVVWRDSSQNISEQRIRAQIKALNADFQARNAELSHLSNQLRGLAGPTGFRFCLARTDPSGSPTTGITRTYTSLPNLGSSRTLDGDWRIFFSDEGGVDAWDTHRYLNIYVCELATFLGIATASNEPNLLGSAQDGVLMDHRAFGTRQTAPPYHLGRTLTHEVGHFFGLAHPWGARLNDCDADDGLADTPPQSGSYIGECPVGERHSCGTPDYYMNFMNFTDDACMAFFTPDQRELMRLFQQEFRPDLPSSELCASQDDTLSFQQAPLKLFPNPTRDFLRLFVGKEADFEYRYAIYHLGSGRLMAEGEGRSGSERALDVRGFPNGVFLMRIFSQGDPRSLLWVKI